MASTNTLYFCLNAQAALDSILERGAIPKYGYQDTFGTMKAVMSAENRQGFTLDYNTPRARPTSTSNRKVSIYGNPRTCSSVSTTAMDYCTGTTAETTDLIDTQITVANEKYVARTYDREVYRDVCDTADGTISAKVAENLLWDAYEIIKAENAALVSAILTARDNYFDGTSSSAAEKTVPLYSSTVPRVPQPGNLYIVLNEYRRKGYDISPILVGGGYLDRFYYDSNFYTGDTAATGRDLSKAPAPIPMSFIDWAVDSTFADGGAHALTWTPGHVQHVTWCDFAENSPLRRTNGEITKTTVMLDIPGLGMQEFDLLVYDSNCDDEVDVKLRRFSEPWVIPSTFFSGTTTCGGQQSVLGWALDCADTTCADIIGPIVT